MTLPGSRPVRIHRTARIHMGMRIPRETSFASLNSGLSWPKKTLWETLMKEARVSTEVISATMQTKMKKKLLLSAPFSKAAW